MYSSILVSAGHTGVSSDVRIHLLLDGQTLSVSHLGPDFLRLDKNVEHAPSTGRLFFSVDGNERQWDVRLPDGIALDSGRVRIANV
jgi:hypothetical protein